VRLFIITTVIIIIIIFIHLSATSSHVVAVLAPEKPYGSLDWPPIKDKYKSGIKPAGIICRTVVLAFL